MSHDTYALAAAAQQTIATWRRALPIADAETLRALLAEDVTFYSPSVQSPIRGREAALLVLQTVSEVLDNIHYHQTFVASPHEVALEFSAEIERLELRGMDRMRFDAAGLVVEFEVIMRPLRALSAVADAVGSRMGPRMLQLKRQNGPS